MSWESDIRDYFNESEWEDGYYAERDDCACGHIAHAFATGPCLATGCQCREYRDPLEPAPFGWAHVWAIAAATGLAVFVALAVELAGGWIR